MNVSPVSASAASQLLQRVFRQADSDASGGISSAELTSASGSEASSTDVTALFKSLDSSSDGQVSASELKSAFDNMSTEMQSALISAQEEATSTADTMKAIADGASTNSDIAGMMSATGAPSQGPPPVRPAGGSGGDEEEEEIDPADANEDGVVSDSEQAAYDSANSGGAGTGASASTETTATEDVGESAASATTVSATKALAAKIVYAASLTA